VHDLSYFTVELIEHGLKWMNILIIEPSSTFQNIIDVDLKVLGISYHIVSTAKDAKDILSSSKFDLICMSLHLPDIYGLDFCEQLRQSDSTSLSPILLLTTEEDKSIRNRAFKLGVTDIYHKQDINSLLQYITYLCQQSNLYKKVEGNILYVEDKQSQADAVISILQEAGLTVNHYLTAEAAYDKFCESDYDLLITDVVLQGDISGLGLVRMIRSSESGKGMLPILALSGIEHSSRKIELLRSGVNDYVSKPFLPEELTTRAKNLVLTKRLTEETDRVNNELLARNLELKETQEKLMNSQKLEALGVMAGGIAHEFNNALAVISGSAEMLLATSPNSSEIQANRILQATDKASKLVSQILTFSQMDIENINQINLTATVLESVNMVRSYIPSNVEVQLDITSEYISIMGDTTQIHQIIINLCMNAFHSMESEGGILQISLSKSSESLVLKVSDTGCGITHDNKQKIFDPFFTTKEVDKGTGLGLSVVYRIIQNLKGIITVDSELGNGTTFTITLPESSETIPVEACDVVDIRGTGHILIVEDEESLAQLYKEYLESIGYITTVRENGLSALNTFKEQPNNFDLILTDNSMPKLTGEELAKELLLIRPELPIILATGYNNMATEKQIQNSGIRKYLIKPVKLGALARAIKSYLVKENN